MTRNRSPENVLESRPNPVAHLVGYAAGYVGGIAVKFLNNGIFGHLNSAKMAHVSQLDWSFDQQRTDPGSASRSQ